MQGLEDIAALPVVTPRLHEVGYSREGLEKVTSGNFLKLMRAAQAALERQACRSDAASAIPDRLRSAVRCST
ncbi:hypothetical protein A9995_12030 [Erythrobacter sp. QSSC1-22B]|nr:hypothetical protein A9995_12030 [Erythrobacter sp. QSSC1-22B]